MTGMADTVKGILNSRERGGATEYKVKFTGSGAVAWVGADKVEQAHIDNFLRRKQKAKAAREQSLKPIKSIDKKKANKDGKRKHGVNKKSQLATGAKYSKRMRSKMVSSYDRKALR